MPDIIIHGASSFIGRHFIRMLSKSNFNVCVLARQQSKIGYLEDCQKIRIIRYNKSLEEIDSLSIGFNRPIFYEFSWHGVFGSERNDPQQLLINIPLMLNSVNFSNKCNASHWIGIGSQAEYGNLDKKINETDECH